MSSLATAADINAIFGHQLGDEEVASFDQLNLLKSAVVEGYCKRTFLTGTLTNRVLTVNDGTLILPDPPVQSVSAITAQFFGWFGGWQNLSLSVLNLLIDPDGTLRQQRYPYWPAGRYEVTYVHGTDVAPDDVRGVTAELIHAQMTGQPSALTVDQKKVLRRYRPTMSTIDMPAPVLVMSRQRDWDDQWQ